MEEIILDHGIVSGKYDNYKQYVEAFDKAQLYITSSALGQSSSSTINKLTNKLKDEYFKVYKSSVALGNAIGEYLDEFSETENKLCSLQAAGADVPTYDGHITEVVDPIVVPGLSTENIPLRMLGYKYSIGDDFRNWIPDRFVSEDHRHCTSYVWRTLKERYGIYLPISGNAKDWDNNFRTDLHGYTFDVTKDGKGGYTNLDKIHSGDVICLEHYGNGLGKIYGHVMLITINPDGSVVIEDSGVSLVDSASKHRTREYKSLEEALEKGGYDLSGGNFTVLSMSAISTGDQATL